MDGRIAFLNNSNRGEYNAQLSTENRTSEVIGLENPRPKCSRNINEYTDVLTTNPASIFNRCNVSVVSRDSRIRSIPDKTQSIQCNSAPSVNLPKRRAGDLPAKLASPLETVIDINDVKATTTPKFHLPKSAEFFPARRRNRDVDFEDIDKLTASLSPHIACTSSANVSSAQSSIICTVCGKCRCADCARPRQLPSIYLCGRTCLCSVDGLVDCLSCACCLKGCLYHLNSHDGDSAAYDRRRRRRSRRHSAPPHFRHDACGKNGANVGASSSSSPSSYSLFGRMNFWKALCLLGACLFSPCLWCYLPLRGCANLCSFCYAKYHDRGCRCLRRPCSNGEQPKQSSTGPSNTRLSALTHLSTPNNTCLDDIKRRSKSCADGKHSKLDLTDLIAAEKSKKRANQYVHLEHRLLMKSYSTGCDQKFGVDRSFDPNDLACNGSRANSRRTKSGCRSDSLLNKIIIGPP